MKLHNRNGSGVIIFSPYNKFKILNMKYDVRSISERYCHITLIPETEIERKLVIIKNEKDKEEKEYTFEVHYGNAIKYKFGTRAHLDGIEADAYPTKIFAEYIFETGSLGNR